MGSVGWARQSGKRFRDPRLHKLFSFQALYAGLSPESALALYAVITYMDSIEGVWFPDGGMHAVPAALALAAEKAGVEFRYSEQVTEILRRSDTGGVAGVRLASGEQVSADAVVCTLDLPVAYERLLPDLAPPRERCGAVSTPRRRSSGMSGCAGHPETGRCPPQHPFRRGVGRLPSTPCSIGAR